MLTIALLAAIPQEYRALMRVMGEWIPLSSRRPKTYSVNLKDRKFFLFEIGIGGGHLDTVLKIIEGMKACKYILVIGFAGALHPKLQVGDVLLGTRFSTCDECSKVLYSISLPPALENFCCTHQIRPAHMVTAKTITPKGKKATLLDNEIAAIEMETFSVVRWAHLNNISFLCFRSISDEVDFPIRYDLNSLTDSYGSIRLEKVVRSLAVHPTWMLPFLRSWRRAQIAARALATKVSAFLSLPLRDLTSSFEDQSLIYIGQSRLLASRENPSGARKERMDWGNGSCRR